MAVAGAAAHPGGAAVRRGRPRPCPGMARRAAGARRGRRAVRLQPPPRPHAARGAPRRHSLLRPGRDAALRGGGGARLRRSGGAARGRGGGVAALSPPRPAAPAPIGGRAGAGRGARPDRAHRPPWRDDPARRAGDARGLRGRGGRGGHGRGALRRPRTGRARAAPGHSDGRLRRRAGVARRRHAVRDRGGRRARGADRLRAWSGGVDRGRRRGRGGRGGRARRAWPRRFGAARAGGAQARGRARAASAWHVGTIARCNHPSRRSALRAGRAEALRRVFLPLPALRRFVWRLLPGQRRVSSLDGQGGRLWRRRWRFPVVG